MSSNDHLSCKTHCAGGSLGGDYFLFITIVTICYVAYVGFNTSGNSKRLLTRWIVKS